MADKARAVGAGALDADALDADAGECQCDSSHASSPV